MTTQGLFLRQREVANKLVTVWTVQTSLHDVHGKSSSRRALHTTPTLVLPAAGRWQGALVAIKIVEHSLKGAAAEIEGARESLLAASISHPNVVSCRLKRCTDACKAVL